jgi:RibD C-terminal domain
VFDDGFKLFEPSRRVFDALADRVGAIVAGRNSYDDAEGWGGEGPHPGDVALMGGGVVTSALCAGLLDEVILHQVPVLLGAGHSFFQELPEHVELSLVEAVPAPGVTHLHYRVET